MDTETRYTKSGWPISKVAHNFGPIVVYPAYAEELKKRTDAGPRGSVPPSQTAKAGPHVVEPSISLGRLKLNALTCGV